jgi:hypothetical protein
MCIIIGLICIFDNCVQEETQLRGQYVTANSYFLCFPVFDPDFTFIQLNLMFLSPNL